MPVRGRRYSHMVFDAYLATKEEEFGILENEVENVTLLLKRI